MLGNVFDQSPSLRTTDRAHAIQAGVMSSNQGCQRPRPVTKLRTFSPSPVEPCIAIEAMPSPFSRA
jgi:hypothetical protein